MAGEPEVVLYNPQSLGGGKRVMPLSLLALGATLEGRAEYAIVDGNERPDALSAVRSHLRAGARVLGVTAMPGPQLTRAVPHSAELKREFPQVTVVWGGYFPTQHADVCLRAPFVDYVVRGHGELSFVALVEALRHGPVDMGLPGVLSRRVPQPAGLPVAPVPNPDELPAFPYHRVNVERYVRRTFLGARTLGHHSSYGCPFVCNFCAVVNMVEGRWRAESPARVEGVVRTYRDRWGVDAVEFYDNNFFTSEARTAEIAERIRPLGVAWWGEGRVDTLLKYSEANFELMRASGLKMVFLGAESGSAEALARMDKGGSLTPGQTLELAARMKAHAIVPEFSFILGNPPDPDADVAHTIEFIRRVKEVNPESEIVMYHYTPVPLAGELFDAARAEGFRFPETLEDWVGDKWQDIARRHSAHMPWLGHRLRRRILDFERVLNAYYPTTTDLRLVGARRALLRAVSAWRYHLRLYARPLELAALQRLFRYQRPETSGF
jgi:anaerobic magnesium-protoporphyrin IX monomethyl ester cyclase